MSDVPDPFGRALLDHHRGERDEPLVQRDGSETLDHPIERFYFGERDPDDPRTEWAERRLSGPFLDLGAGVGRDAIYFQEQFETVALEVSEHLVTAMDERDVADARPGDMFALREAFDRDRFRSVRALGTQATLAHSPGRLRSLLADLAYVTDPDGVAILDAYDPSADGSSELLGYRSVPDPGVGYRTFHFEYDGEVGETLLFRHVSPDRLGRATTGTDWSLAEVEYDDYHYDAVLRKDG